MVLLFMVGDKQFMWHANRLMKETNLRLMTDKHFNHMGPSIAPWKRPQFA